MATPGERMGVRMPMANLKIMNAYLDQDLGDFYTHPTNRLLLYPFIFSFFLVECASFWLFYLGPGFVVEYMAFTTVYTLHKAATYTICILTADILTHHLAPWWGRYEHRTVAKQWMIWSLGLAAGFILQRTMVRALIPVYASDVVAYFRTHPEMRLSTVTLLMILVPYWIFVVFLTVQVARSRQRVQRLSKSLKVVADDPHAENPPGIEPAGILQMAPEKGNGAIALANISHVTVEDHYCRIHHTTENGLKSEMVRLPLKELLHKLPHAHFVQIHRSHVVNAGHVVRLAKKGRDRKAVLRHKGVELPVSRSRFKDLGPKLRPNTPDR